MKSKSANDIAAAMLIFFALVISSLALFGSPARPLLYLAVFGSPFPVWYTGLICLAGALGGYAVLVLAKRLSPTLRPALLVLGFAFSALLGAEMLNYSVQTFQAKHINAERSRISRVLISLHKAPAGSQFFLHGAALVNCAPMAWSHSTQSFYELPSNIAVNVLPDTWVDECQISIER